MTTTRREREIERSDLGPGPGNLRHPVAVGTAVALGVIVLAYQALTGPPTQSPPAVYRDGGSRSEGRGEEGSRADASSSGATKRKSSPALRAAEDRDEAAPAPGLEAHDTPAEEMSAESVFRPPEPDPLLSDPAHDLIDELAQMKPEGEEFSASEIEIINLLVRELGQMGEMALPAIRDYLESRADVEFRDASGDRSPDRASLRIALLDTLRQIPGHAALDLMAQAIRGTGAPEEIAVLASALERRSPGRYRREILSAIRRVLATASRGDPQAYPEPGHLFGVIQDHGDASVTADLEAVSKVFNKGSVWADLSLMALSKLPEGKGLPSLIGVSNEIADGEAPAGSAYNTALRMLAQASNEYPEAGEALVQLAETGKIGMPVFVNLATTLGGMEVQLLGPGTRSKAVMQGTMDAPSTWSKVQIDERFALIDRLLITNPEPQVVRALQEAQRRLERWRSRT